MMDTQFVIEAHGRRARSLRMLAVKSLGPLTVAGGVVWAFAQPYRITLLHPRGQGFWWLVVEPPILVVLAGLAFALLVVPGLVEDLEEGADATPG
jgi:hypothetical protein